MDAPTQAPAAAHRLRGRQLAFWIALLIFQVVVIEGLTRVGLGLHGVAYEEIAAFNRRWQRTLDSDGFLNYAADYPYLPYRVRPGRPAYSNSKGYRGPEFAWSKAPGTARVAFLGGSTTWEGTYPREVGRLLDEARLSGPGGPIRFEVLNFGAESWTSAESLVNFAIRGVHADPDYVVVYHAINDAIAATHPASVTPEPDYSHWRKRLTPPARSWVYWIPAWLDRFRAVGLVRHYFYRRDAGDAWSTAMRRYLFDAGQPFQGTQTFRSNLEGLVAIATDRGAAVFLVTQVHSPEWSRATAGSDVMIERVARLNQVVRSVAADHAATGSVFLIDAASAAERMDLLSQMTDWCHFTKRGYESLARLVASEIRSVLEPAA